MVNSETKCALYSKRMVSSETKCALYGKILVNSETKCALYGKSCNRLCEHVEHVGPLGRAEKSRADLTVSPDRVI
ncbi:hypothetical protein EVAR_69739_1 [Eumeta japonica]|uniref:Uncharacterized protein n=1 Tax=Eumeta variegata TaxID=151549 RepID=A0A4C2A4F1_EUMVA|nr:hypothetical protein EVAR_69739_1 [Eumeta japonica]